MLDGVPKLLVVVGAGSAVAVAAALARAMPRTSFVLWLGTIFFVPVWVGVSLGPFWAVATLATLLMLCANGSIVSLNIADLCALGFVVLLVVLRAQGAVTLSAFTIGILEWMVPYLWGRVVLARVSSVFVTNAVGAVAVACGLFAIVEFATGANPFVLMPGSGVAYETWSPIQVRGGVPRVEGAFGHSIALGASLAVSAAFVAGSRWRSGWKVASLGVIATAVVLTFSRAGLVTLSVTLVLAFSLLRGVSSRLRAMFAITALLSSVLVAPAVSAVFDASGTDLEVSGEYRHDLLVLLSQVQPFGNAGEWESLVVGDSYLGYFSRSVDNAVVVMALRFGWVPTVLLVAVIIFSASTVFRPATRNPAAIAVLGQLPSLIVVALITQFGMFLWFCIGLAIGWADERRADSAPTEPFGGSIRSSSRHAPGQDHFFRKYLRASRIERASERY